MCVFYVCFLVFLILIHCAKATALMEINLCFRKMYVAPLWIPKQKAKNIAEHGLKYLELFQLLARKASTERRPLFLFNSKVHMNDHIFRNLAWEAEMGDYALNPLVWGVQLDEDLIGKASRLTRHVSSIPHFTIRRSLQRWLIAGYHAWSKAGMLERIWHGRGRKKVKIYGGCGAENLVCFMWCMCLKDFKTAVLILSIWCSNW